jgi:hydroxyethylthiazole kinase-like uncharacterized protein yjeF
MELAGWHMVSIFRQLKIDRRKSIGIFCGVGNKGGDGLAAARHLHNHGWPVEIIMIRQRKISPDAAHHLRLLKLMNIPIYSFTRDRSAAHKCVMNASVIVDSLIGYHLQGAPRGSFAEAIELIGRMHCRVISYDLPSGVDATTGQCYQPCIRANTTLTLALPKKAFKSAEAIKRAGRIYLADIGIPEFLYDKIQKGSRPSFERCTDNLIKV